MTDIRPWLEADDAPSHLRNLLREAQPSQTLDPRTQARSRQRLMAMTALPAAAGVMFWIKSIALGAVLGGALATAVYAPEHRQLTTAPAVTASQPVPRVNRAPRNITASLDASVEEPGPPRSVASIVLPAPARSSAAALPSAEPSQLSREMFLLERARQLLRNDPKQALLILDTHRREFPHTAIETERELMAVDALLRLGRPDDALTRAAQLRARAPGSIYEQRLQRLIDKKSE